MKSRVISAVSLALLAAITFCPTHHSQAQTDWYSGPIGIPANDSRLLGSSIPYQVRRRFQATPVKANRDNSWIVWASAWSVAQETGRGRAYVKSLELYAVDKNGKETPVNVQTWDRGELVYGGCYMYSATTWFGKKINGQDFFAPGAYTDNSGAKQYAARIDTSTVENDPAVCHIWQNRWPRDVMPDGTVKVRVKAQFVAYGDALINVGLDRYRTDKEGDQPEQEVLVSDTYSADQGIVSVVMDSAPIDWTK